MDDQYILNWKCHQSTMISLFDKLLESGAWSDCTLAAEGQYLKAHKVVLSACSPYLELLLSQHNEKHPIIILKDVKFQELKMLMEYMYRGAAQMSLDQFLSLAKVAESLEIKGLSKSDISNNEDSTASSAPAKAPVASAPTTRKRRSIQCRSLTSDNPDSHIDVSNSCDEPLLQPRKSIQQSVTRGPSTVAQGLTVERKPESPQIRYCDDRASTTRKRRRIQPRVLTSDDPDSHIGVSNSCDVPLLQAGALSAVGVPNIPASITKGAPLDDSDHETDNSRINNLHSAAEGVAGPKIEPTGELIEPKPEYLEDMNNKDSRDLILSDDELRMQLLLIE